MTDFINATLFGQAITFTIFVWFCMKFVWPPLIAAIEARQMKIQDGLASAERAAQDLAQAQSQSESQLQDAKQEAATILEQANKRKAQIVEEAKVVAEAEKARIIDQGQAELDAERNRAKEELRKQVSVLAVQGAEKIIGRTIDASAHADIVDSLAKEL